MRTQNWLEKQAQTNPNQIAVDDGEERLTFFQLEKEVKKLVGKLNKMHPGGKVGLLANNTLIAYELALAIVCSNRTIVWLNWRLADEELLRQAADSQLELILVDSNLWRDNFDQRFCKYDDFLSLEADLGSINDEFDLNRVASIMYTSGTTGKAKGVLQTFGNHFYSAVSSALNLGLNTDDEWLCVAPIFHISGFSIVMRGLIYGMTVRLVKKFNANQIEKILANEKVSIMSVVPFMLKKLIEQRQKSHETYNPDFRCMLLGGGTTDRPTLLKCRDMNIPIVQCYGMTETCSQIVALKATDALDHIGSVGQPLFTTQLKLDAKGQILLKTPALTPGYLNMPEKLKQKMKDGWYQTGDIGHLDHGYLYIDGRIDEMLISGGENIFPQEVEQVYNQLPDIQEIAVVGKKDSVWGEIPVAFVISGKKLSKQNLIDYGYAHLAHYKVPKQYYFVKKIPKNASGKIQRYLLKEKLS